MDGAGRPAPGIPGSGAAPVKHEAWARAEAPRRRRAPGSPAPRRLPPLRLPRALAVESQDPQVLWLEGLGEPKAQRPREGVSFGNLGRRRRGPGPGSFPRASERRRARCAPHAGPSWRLSSAAPGKQRASGWGPLGGQGRTPARAAALPTRELGVAGPSAQEGPWAPCGPAAQMSPLRPAEPPRRGTVRERAPVGPSLPQWTWRRIRPRKLVPNPPAPSVPLELVPTPKC